MTKIEHIMHAVQNLLLNAIQGQITSVSLWHLVRSTQRHSSKAVMANSSFMTEKPNA